MEITPIKQSISLADLIKVAIYGDQGIGKTTSLATFPGKKLIINTTSGGLASLAGKSDIYTWDLTKLTYREAYGSLERLQTQLLNKQLGELQDFDTICLDDFSGLLDIFMKRAQDSNIKKSGGVSEVPTLQHYMAESTLATQFLMALMNTTTILGKPFVCTFHVNQEVDEGGAIRAIYPRVRGKDRGSNILRHFSEVYYMTSKTTLSTGKASEVRVWRTTSTRLIAAKSRLKNSWPEMGDEIPPDFGPIYSKILEVMGK